MSNPLLSKSSLPQFSKIKAEHVKPAVEQAINNCRDTLAQLLAENTIYTWDNLIAPLDEVDDVLGKLWSPVSHLNSVKNSDELRKAYEACLPLLSEFSTFIGQHQCLFNAYQQIANSEEFNKLDQAQ